MKDRQLLTRCEMCDVLYGPGAIANVPDEAMMLCRRCAKSNGLVIEEAADGSFGIVRNDVTGGPLLREDRKRADWRSAPVDSLWVTCPE